MILVIIHAFHVFAQVDTSMNATYRNNMPNNGMNNNLNPSANPNNNNATNSNGNMPNSTDLNRMYNDHLRLDSLRDALYGGSKEPMRLSAESQAYSDRMRDSLRTMYGDRMRIDSTPKNNNRMQSQPILNGMYNGQKIRSDTIRDGRYDRDDKMTIKQRDKADAAQQTKRNTEMTMTPNEKHVMMTNGKVMMMKNGHTIAIKAYTPLNNGAKVLRDGSIIQQDGTKTMLQEGECINAEGNMVAMPMNMNKNNMHMDNMNKMHKMKSGSKRDSMQKMNMPKMNP